MILSFVEAPAARLLTVLGPAYAGKSRLVIEALRPHAAVVLWASEPEEATLDLFRDLDTGDLSMILVVDRCPPAALAAIRERALARTRLKTIAIGVGRGDELGPDEPGVLRIGRLDYPAAARLVRTALPAAAPLQEAWVVEAAAGNPGLVLQIAALLRVSAVSASSSPDDVRHRLGSLIESHYLGQLAPAIRQALEIVSLLSVVGVQGTAGDEFDALCAARGVSAALARGALPELREQGLVRERGHFVEVIPPLLAEHVASRALRPPDALLDDPGFRVRLGPRGFLRFLERLRDLPSDDVQRAIARLFHSDGWFPDLDSLGAHIERFRVLAPAAPEASLGCLERLLGGLTPDELRNRAAGDLGRSVVATLDDLALRRKTFGRAARLLLALAEAENETWSDSARGAFVELFHLRHPEVAAPLPVRAAVLKDDAASASARRRAIVARACGAAFREDWVLFHHEPKGPEVPRPAYRPRTEEEIREYARDVLQILRALAQDAEGAVQRTAIASLLECLPWFVELSLLPDGLHALGEKALDTVEGIGRGATCARRRGQVVSCLELILSRLEEHGEGWAPGTRRNLVERLRELLDRLTTGSLKDLLWRWVGPASPSLEDEQGDARRRDRIPSLAAALVSEPERLAEHLDWLTSDEAEHRALLFRELGKRSKGALIEALTRTVTTSPYWHQALASYFQGWHDAAAEGAQDCLDALVERRSDLSPGLVAATLYLPPSERTVARIRRIAARGSAPRADLAGQVGLGLQWDRLSAEATEELIRALDDGTPPARSALLHAFWLRLARGAEMSASLTALAWSLLESTAPVSEDPPARTWDWLAGKLGERDSGRLLELFGRVVRSRARSREARFDVSHELPLVWKNVRFRERPGVVRLLLETAAAPDAPYWIEAMLSKTVNVGEDRTVLLELVDRRGVEGARVVAEILDPDRRESWELARDLLLRHGGDLYLRSTLLARLLCGRCSAQQAQLLRSDADANVARWAEEAIEALEGGRNQAEREDREEWIWEQPMSRSELEGLLREKDSPERLWAIGRLLEHAPEARVRELLTAGEILDALPSLGHLAERIRRKWEGYARHWSGAG